MRNVYIVTILLFITSVVLFIGTFIYLDRVQRKAFHYVLQIEGREAGSVKIDRYVTEESLIYKSASEMPLEPIFSDAKVKLTLDRKYEFKSFYKEASCEATSEYTFVENKDGVISFVSNFDSRFAALDGMAIRRNTLVFDEDEVATYLPFVENYNFRTGGPQAFYAVKQFSVKFPPMRVILTLTSIRDDYLKVDGRKIKTECILLKIRDHPQVTLWVSKMDHSVITIEIPSKSKKFIRTFSPRKIDVDYAWVDEVEGYRARDVYFLNDNIMLAGTLTAPQKDGVYPGVILVWGPGPQDRDYRGLFSGIADHLSRNNFCVMRFDKRGVGASGGNFATYTVKEEISDAVAAIDFLSKQNEVDKSRIVLIGHSEGGYYISKIASMDTRIKACVILSGTVRMGHLDRKIELLKYIGEKSKWSKEYMATVIKAETKAYKTVVNTQKAWAAVSRHKCYLERMRQEYFSRPLEAIKEVKIPILLLHGNKDAENPPRDSKLLNIALDEAGTASHSLVYFGYLGHFFGKEVFDGVKKRYYQADPDVLRTINDWLNDNLADVVEVNSGLAESQTSPAEHP